MEMNPETTGQGGFAGQQGITSDNSEFNALYFAINQVLATVSTIKVVKVTEVDAAARTVEVTILVDQIDGIGKTTSHGTIFNVPFITLQGGKNAVLIDPAKDDIGLLLCSDRDISAVKNTKERSTPGSFRRFNVSDGIYLGGLLNGSAERFVKITDDGIQIVADAGNKVELKVGNVTVAVEDGQITSTAGTNSVVVSPVAITFNGPVVFNGPVSGQPGGGGTINFGTSDIQTSGSIDGGAITGTAVNQGSINLSTHKHVAPPGGGNTGPSIP